MPPSTPAIGARSPACSDCRRRRTRKKTETRTDPMSGPNASLMVPGLRRNMVTICAMTATIMQALDTTIANRSEEHTSELQSRQYLVCRLLLEKKKEADAGLERVDLVVELAARE